MKENKFLNTLSKAMHEFIFGGDKHKIPKEVYVLGS
jgi:hypothetical protein